MAAWNDGKEWLCGVVQRHPLRAAVVAAAAVFVLRRCSATVGVGLAVVLTCLPWVERHSAGQAVLGSVRGLCGAALERQPKRLVAFKDRLPASVLERRAAAERRELETSMASETPPPPERSVSPGWTAIAKTPAVQPATRAERGWSLLGETPAELHRRRGAREAASPPLAARHSGSSDDYVDVGADPDFAESAP